MINELKEDNGRQKRNVQLPFHALSSASFILRGPIRNNKMNNLFLESRSFLPIPSHSFSLVYSPSICFVTERQPLLVLAQPLFLFFLAQPNLLCYQTTSDSCYRTSIASCSCPTQIYNGHDRLFFIYDVAALVE